MESLILTLEKEDKHTNKYYILSQIFHSPNFLLKLKSMNQKYAFFCDMCISVYNFS